MTGAVCEGTDHFVGDNCDPPHQPRWGHLEPDGTHAFTSREALEFLNSPEICGRTGNESEVR